jgi:hypothetical protein
MTTMEDSIWENGQSMLLEIARQESLRLGPNRRMQELMVRRNDEILAYLASNNSNTGLASLDLRIEEINSRYIVDITEAARQGPDDGEGRGGSGRRHGRSRSSDNALATSLTLVSCTAVILISVCFATWLCISRKKETPINTFTANDHVVIGSPVIADPSNGAVHEGTAVTVAAPTRKSKNPGEASTSRGKSQE